MTSTDLRATFRYRRLIFWSLAFGYILVFFHRLCPAVVATDMMNDLHASGALIGFLSSAYFYPYALMQLPTGLLSDTWGPRKTITLFLCAACAGSILLGLTPTPAGAVAGRLLVGLGVSTLFVCTLKILAEWFSIREFVSMTGILVAMGGVGSLTAATPLAMVSSRLGWRMSFVLVGILTGLLAALVWKVVRDRPSDMGLPSPAEHASVGAPPMKLIEGVRQVLTRPAFWPLAAWFFFKYGIFTSFAGLWGGPYLMQVYGMTKSGAGALLSLVAVGMIIGSPALGYLSSRVLKRRKPALVFASLAMLAITALLTFAVDRLTPVLLGGVCFGFGVFASAIAVIGFACARELFPSRIAGTCIGLLNLFPFMGGAVMQPLMGAILERYGKTGTAFTTEGYSQAFLALFISALAALAASLFVEETMGKKPVKGKAGEAA